MVLPARSSVGQRVRQEAAAHLGGAAQAGLDDVDEPGGVAGEEVGVQIDERAVAAAQLGQDGTNARPRVYR